MQIKDLEVGQAVSVDYYDENITGYDENITGYDENITGKVQCIHPTHFCLDRFDGTSIADAVEELQTKQNNKMRTISAALKRIFSPALREQYRAGLINSDSTLTHEGREELFFILQDEYKDELTDRAKEIIKESKEDCKK